MELDPKTVAFEIPTVSQGFQVAKGLVKLNVKDEALEFEFEVKDSIVGLYSSGVEEVVVPLDRLESIEYKKGLFSSKILLEAQSLKVFEDLPGSEQAEVTLKIKRKDRQDAANLVSRARLAMSEQKLREMGEEG